VRDRPQLCVVLALALAGCNLAPDYHPPALTAPADYKETGPWHAAKPADDLSRGPWWERFGDRRLDALEVRVEGANPDLAAAAARYDQARALADEAAAGLSPQVALGGSLSDNRQSGDRPLRGSGQPNYYGANQVGVAAGYEFDFWGRIHNMAVSGTRSAQASAADLATLRLGLQAELAVAYFTVRGLDDQAALLQDSVAAYEKSLSLTQRLVAGKIVAGMDVSRARTQLETARAQLSDTQARRSIAEHSVALLVGAAPADFSLQRETNDIALPSIPAGVPSTLLQRRPDIAAAERRVAAANSVVGVTRAAFYPTLSLGLLGGFQSTNLNFFNLPDSVWSIGPGITLPLLDGGRLDAEEAAAVAQFKEAGANYRSAVLRAFREVEDDAAQLRWLASEADSEAAAVTAAQQTLDAAMRLYRQGAGSYLDVTTAQIALLQAQQAALDVKTRRLLADVGLIRALGGGWGADALDAAG